jgi:acetolactate synthase I/II/III large subunit
MRRRSSPSTLFVSDRAGNDDRPVTERIAVANQPRVDRREFMKLATSAGAAVVAPAAMARPQTGQGAPTQAPAQSNDVVENLTEGRSGSDFMVDLLKSLDFGYVCSNTGSSFRGLQESVVNYGGNTRPEFLTCCHEESSVAMAHGYYKVEGKPLAVFAHGTVGLQHASMAIYNAWCDRVPVYIILGNTLDAAIRQPPVEWVHSVQDAAAMVRDFIKWDDTPVSLPHFAESAIRAYRVAMTPPRGPVVLVADTELQERPVPEHVKLTLPKLTLLSPPQAEANAVEEIAKALVAADNPLLLVDGRALRTSVGMAHLVELAELLQSGVFNVPMSRTVFPTRHPLNVTNRIAQVVGAADVILGLEFGNLYGSLHGFRDQVERTLMPLTKPGTRVMSLGVGEMSYKSNYQDFLRFQPVDVAAAGDVEATLPALLEAVRRGLTSDRRRAAEARGARLARESAAALELARMNASYAWDASPVTTARLAAELWEQIKSEDWSLVSEPRGAAGWPGRLWSFDKFHQSIGGSGGAGIGYNAPATVGAALANKKYGRLSVSIQPDGDMMYAPGVLWTAAHHNVPLLIVMHNNRAYHEEVMHLQRMCGRRERGIDRAQVGTTMTNPNIDFARLAQSMGVHADGPIENPKDLAPAIRRALEVVKRGEPALVDVVTQPR